MKAPSQKPHYSMPSKTVTDKPLNCRCSGKSSQPKLMADFKDRWIIRCQVERCYAYNIGQGLADTIQGWNRLSKHFYR